MRYFTPWTPEEDSRLGWLRSRGHNWRTTAEILDRTVFAAKCRYTVISRRSPVISAQIVRIPIAEVPYWYELGWRFDGFIFGGMCRMEWRSTQPERRPVTVVLPRELEAA